MKWAAAHAATGWPSQYQRRRSIPSVVRLRDHVDDLVVRTADEVHELKFSDWPHARKCRTEGSAHYGCLRKGSVNYTLAAEMMNESFCNFECAAVDPDVFTDAEDGRIPLHLFPNAFADCFEIGDGCHYRRCATSLAAPSFFFSVFLTLGLPYRRGISAELSEKTRSAAVEPSGYGEASANSRSSSICLCVESIRSVFSFRLIQRFSSRYFSMRVIGSRFFQYSKHAGGTYAAASCMACPRMRIILASISVAPSPA